MSIQKFYQVAQQRDFARLFQFRVARLGTLDFGVDDLIYAETATLPGRSITNVPVPYMGLPLNVPGTATYPGSAGYQIAFRCDQNYNIRNILENGTFGIFDESTSTGNYNTPQKGSTVVLQLLGKEMNGNQAVAIRTYTLFGAWIQAIADTNYDIKDTGTIQTVQCTFAYQFWRARNGAAPATDPIGLPTLL